MDSYNNDSIGYAKPTLFVNAKIYIIIKTPGKR